MTREQTIEAIRVMQAYVDGKEVQHLGKKWNPRELLKPDWCDTHEPFWNLEHYEYRIKPAATIRPWTADEVPLGAWIRYKGTQHDRMIISWTSNQADRDMWLDEREHSTDGGKTWSVCGVMEESR